MRKNDNPSVRELRKKLRNRQWMALRSVLLSVVPDVLYAKWVYWRTCNKELHLKEPKTFDDKQWWLKLNNRDPQLTRCSDKLAVRDYVAECGFADILVPLYGIWDRAQNIDFNVLSEESILKCNKGSGGNIFFRKDGELDNETGRALIRRALAFESRWKYQWLSREWNYKNIAPQIIAEWMLRDSAGHWPTDYKFLSFEGEVRLVCVKEDSFHANGTYNRNYTLDYCDAELHTLPISDMDRTSGVVHPQPENYARMKEIAQKLSEPFPFCRVDLYNVDGKIYFGEITLYHSGGCRNIQPPEWDLRMGSWINLNNPHIVLRGKHG
ncbi:MAG: hypothetical protein FWF10_02135 [Clostridiales bacterium]|nr:hypothetical protein [Clostridiales bacterium]